MILRLLAIFFLFLTSCASNPALLPPKQGIEPSEEVKQPVPDYWSDEISDMNFIDPRTCDGSYTPPSVKGGLRSIQAKIQFPDDGNAYSQRITAALVINKEGEAEKIWFPYHAPSIATDAVEKAVLASEFIPSTCNGVKGYTKYMITIRAQN